MTKTAVIGLGTMGPGIAATLARAGMTVSAYDADAGQREKAKAGLDMAVGVLGNLGVEDRKGWVAVAATLAECVKHADLVIETVPENLELKHKVFGEIEALVSKDCILASD